MVHQELNQCLERNVIDNLFLGRYPTNSMGVVDEGGMKKKASELFRKLGMTVNLTQPMRNMSVSQRQMCEIAKAISYNSQVIVLDEPTSSLTVQEVDKLFEMMRMLKEQGIALIYISHKMDEIFEICDEISVLRDGQSGHDKGRQGHQHERADYRHGGPLSGEPLPSGGQHTRRHHFLCPASLHQIRPPSSGHLLRRERGRDLRPVRLVGAGRTELLETIFGVRTRAAGPVYFKNRLMNFNNAKEAIEHGFALITRSARPTACSSNVT